MMSVFCLSFGQQFFEGDLPYDNKVAESTSEIYKDITPIDAEEFDFYGTVSNDSIDDVPDYGEDGGPGNPGDAPIDGWLFLLPVAASLLAYRYIRKSQFKNI